MKRLIQLVIFVLHASCGMATIHEMNCYKKIYVCHEMKAGQHEGGAFISFNMTNEASNSSLARVAIFHYHDRGNLESEFFDYIHRYKLYHYEGSCTSNSINQPDSSSPNPEYRFATYHLPSLKNEMPYFEIVEDGCYCVKAVISERDPKATIEFHNYFGYGTLLEYYLMRALGWLTIIHLLSLMYYIKRNWSFMHQLSKLQKHHIILMVIRMIDTWLQWYEYRKTMNKGTIFSTDSYSTFTLVSEMYTVYVMAYYVLGEDEPYFCYQEDKLFTVECTLAVISIFKIATYFKTESNLEKFLFNNISSVFKFYLWIRSFKSFRRVTKYLRAQSQWKKLSMYQHLRVIMLILPFCGYVLFFYTLSCRWKENECYLPEYDTMNELTYHLVTAVTNFLISCSAFYIWQPTRHKPLIKQ